MTVLLRHTGFIPYRCGGGQITTSLTLSPPARASPAYSELEERLELLESSLAPVSPHMEERLELLEVGSQSSS